MALVIQSAPTFRCKIPSTKKEIRYRAYSVKEEKILLMALASGDDKEMLDGVKQIVTNCLVDKDVNVDELTVYDFDYLMMKIRSKSSDDKIHIKFKGREGTDCQHCKKDKIVEIDLNEVEVEFFPGHEKKIMLREDLGVLMHDTLVKESSKYETGGSITDRLDNSTNLIVDSIDTIFDKDKIYNTRDFTRDEIKQFVEDLPTPEFKKLEAFFDTMPMLRKKLDLSCKECGYEEFYTLQRLQDFFE